MYSAGVSGEPTVDQQLHQVCVSLTKKHYIQEIFNMDFILIDLRMLTLSSLNLTLSSSSTTSRELLSQFSTCSG